MNTSQKVSGSKGIIIFIVIFVAIVTLFVGLYIRRREIAFEGEVVDKDIIENQTQNNMMNRPGITIGGASGGVTHTYRIKVKTDAGKEINYHISEGKYEIIKIGDRVSKPKGTTEVNIIPSATNVPTPPQPPTPPAPTSPAPPQTFV